VGSIVGKPEVRPSTDLEGEVAKVKDCTKPVELVLCQVSTWTNEHGIERLRLVLDRECSHNS